MMSHTVPDTNKSTQTLIDAYYTLAPHILNALSKREDEEEILEEIYGIVTHCVRHIKAGQEQAAFALYKEMVHILEALLPLELPQGQERHSARCLVQP